LTNLSHQEIERLAEDAEMAFITPGSMTKDDSETGN
jgi:hypothetical protein